jgi:hypothetical protein
MNRIAQILGGMVRGIWHGAGMPEPPAGWTFVDVTDRPAAKVGDTYDAVTDTFTTPTPVPPVKTLSKSDVIGVLTPAQWSEMQRYHPDAAGTSPAGTPYNDPSVYWAVSVFNAATKDFDLDDPRITSILGLLVQKGVIAPGDVAALQSALAEAAS